MRSWREGPRGRPRACPKPRREMQAMGFQFYVPEAETTYVHVRQS